MSSPEAGALLSLQGKVALVTGGAGAIGSAVAARLETAGAVVVRSDRPGAKAADGAPVAGHDVTRPRDVAALLAEIGERHGRLDVLVHAAGIVRDGVLWKTSLDDWEAVLRTNLDSAFLLLKGAVPMMRAAGGGAVVLIASINGERGKFGQANYAASKAGLIGLARTAARETGRFGIRVNVVSPGLIESPMTAALSDEQRRRAVEETALGRAGRPDDVARAVLFLATEMSGHVTGQVLRVDGGQLIG